MTPPRAEVARLIGEATIGFGVLELYLNAAIWRQASRDDKAREMVQAMDETLSFREKVECFRNLFLGIDVPPRERAAAVRVAQKLWDVSDEQSKVMHAIWHDASSFGGLTRLKGGRGDGRFTFRVHPAYRDGLETLLRAIKGAADDLLALHQPLLPPTLKVKKAASKI